MRLFYLLLMVLWGALAFYTAQVIATQGWNLFPAFIGDLARWGWPGQFNFDFTLMLVLSASWTAWRGEFAPAALARGVVAFLGGAMFLLPYLTYLAWRHDGDTAAILLGRLREDSAA